MFRVGVLCLTSPLPVIQRQIPNIISEVSRYVNKTLYVHIQPSQKPVEWSNFKINPVPCSDYLQKIITELHSRSASSCSSNLDVRILLGHVTHNKLDCSHYDLHENYDVIMVDDGENLDEEFVLENFRKIFHSANRGVSLQKLNLENVGSIEEENGQKTYDSVCLGGTFDRIHAGHKILLAMACSITEKELTVGVTEPNMNKKKTLYELITPTQMRINEVAEYLNDCKPNVNHKVVPIEDLYGPSIVDPSINCIVLSDETRSGGVAINKKRAEKGMTELDQFAIELVEDKCRDSTDEEKISSSSRRKRLLGSLINPLSDKADVPRSPYRIGLAGGIACGKSSIAKRLEGLGAGIVDCDKLGHRAYLAGTPGHQKIVDAFGETVVGTDGEIDRKKLGPIVFSDKKQLEKLNSIVWPEIARLAEEEIQKFKQEGKKVVVLDAAVLLEAGWDSFTHEVWVSIVPPDEAVQRIMDRNKFSEEESRKRINSQMSNQERVDRANVILSTLWEYDYTQKQVEKAWELLMQRISDSS